MAFLRRQNPYDHSPRPDLILLDLNLPRKDGREVLTEVKADCELRRIPVVIQTTSRDAEDIRGCYDLHANSYVTKPVALKEFLELVRRLEEYWFSIVTLPTE